MIAQLTTNERQFAMVMLIVLAVAGLVLAVAGRILLPAFGFADQRETGSGRGAEGLI